LPSATLAQRKPGTGSGEQDKELHVPGVEKALEQIGDSACLFVIDVPVFTQVKHPQGVKED